MINHIETFTKKTNNALERNIKMQELLSEAAMRIDRAQDYQANLLKYVERHVALSEQVIDKFCKENQGTLDIILNEQNFLMDDIKNMIRAMDAYAMHSFVNQNMLAHTYKVHNVSADAKKPILGKALPAEEYYDHLTETNTKGN